MLESYERELNKQQLSASIQRHVKESLIIASVGDVSLESIPVLKYYVEPDSLITVSNEGKFTTIFESIIKLIKKIILSIYKLLIAIFRSDASLLDSDVSRIKRKLSKAAVNTEKWTIHSIQSITDGIVQLHNNTMLFKLISTPELNYFKRLSELSYLNDIGVFLSSYENVTDLMSKSKVDEYRELYDAIKSLDNMKTEGGIPKDGEMVLPITINGNTISFIIVSLSPDGTGLELIKPRTISLVLKNERFIKDLSNKDYLYDMMLDVYKSFEYLEPVNGVIGSKTISDEEIASAIERIAIFYMRSTDGKATQRAVASYLSALSEGCSLSLRNHLRNIETVNTVLNEIINYKEK